MLSQDENALLTCVGSGTPCGELMRRYWQPAALSEELPPGGAPLPVSLLGEDLVLFRDEAARPGLLGLHCSHRGADLSYGRLDDGGLRCIYHGWLYDIHGRCLEQPGEPAGSTFHEKISHRAYPCREVGGVILTYMGPGEPPLVPAYEFLTAPEEYSFATKIYRECNYLQGNEGNIDPQHPGFLHRLSPDDPSPTARGGSPTIEVEETDFGIRQFTLFRVSSEQCYFKVDNFVLPNFSTIGGGAEGDGYTANWHVPIDDTHHWEYVLTFSRETPLDREAIREKRGVMPDYRLARTSRNRYLQDRDSMRHGPFTGMGTSFYEHDGFATESQGPIQDRTQENLAYTDKTIIAARRMLRRAIDEVRAGREAPGVVRDPRMNDFRHIILRREVIPVSVRWRNHWERILQARARAVDGSDEGSGGTSPIGGKMRSPHLGRGQQLTQ